MSSPAIERGGALPASTAAEPRDAKAPAGSIVAVPDPSTVAPQAAAAEPGVGVPEPAQPSAGEDQKAVHLERICTVSMAGALVGIAAEFCKGVTRLTRVTPMALTPAYLRGVLDLRGRMLPVLDLRDSLGLASDAAPGDQALIVSTSGLWTALAVDEVLSFEAHDLEALRPFDGDAGQQLSDHGRGWLSSEHGEVAVLDLRPLIEGLCTAPGSLVGAAADSHWQREEVP